MTKAAIIKRLMEDEEKRVTAALQIKDYMLVESLGKRLHLLKILSSGEWYIDELSDFNESIKRTCSETMSNKNMNHIDYVLRHRCPICKMSITFEEFRDKLSVSEYKISGICQRCQDVIFSEEYDEEY